MAQRDTVQLYWSSTAVIEHHAVASTTLLIEALRGTGYESSAV